MNKFSLYNYEMLSDSLKVGFNKALAQRLLSMLDEIKSDDDLNNTLIENFILSSGHCFNSVSIVEDLYFKISSGIQVGSGNQNLFLGILAEYTDSWETISR